MNSFVAMPIVLRSLLCLLAVLTVSQAANLPAIERAPTDKPNIVFILADDLGIDNLSCYGGDKYKTPRLDKLAADGTRFTRAYGAPLCGPSRAMIMTGRYAFRTGATNQDRVAKIKPEDEIMMPKLLKTAGYATASIGKWSQFGLTPADFGFDTYLTYKGSGIYWNTQPKGKEYLLNGETVALKDKEYMPDVMHKLFVDFITEHRASPFYVYYSLSSVHTDILPTPDSAPDSKDLYGDNMAYLDKTVGRVVDDLERLGLSKNTVVVFVGDNGTTKKGAGILTVGGREIDGNKGSMMEGGSLVPMIANWPGTTPAGKVSADLIDFSDFYPTFASLAGAKLPEGVTIDGQSFAPQLLGQPGQPRDWAFVQLARMWYVRNAGWKLNEKGELYDLSDAPFVQTLVPADTTDPAAVAARKQLQAALDKLNPAGGILDDGDGTGRHANKEKKKKDKASSD
ncbi:MAG: sulfatase-like hydrolase/transferase [Sphaerospermopsis kisseleviana]